VDSLFLERVGNFFERRAHRLLLVGLSLDPVAHDLLFAAHVLDQTRDAIGEIGHGGSDARVGAALFLHVAQALGQHADFIGRTGLGVGDDDVEEVRRRLVERGATVLYAMQQGPTSWVTMADPEGNEFCV